MQASPECLAVDLADRRERQRSDDVHLARVLVAADPLLRPGDELPGLEWLPERDERHDLFAALRVPAADDRRALDRGVFEERLLDVAREDVEAAPDDQILLAVDDVEVAVVVHPPEVARVQPAAAHRLLSLFGSPPVAAHDERGAT